MERHQIHGIGVVAVQGGQVSLAKGYGFANYLPNLHWKAAFTDQSPFFSSTVTTTLLAIALAKLVETGQVAIDASLTDFVEPRFFLNPQQANEMTIRQLLMETNGFSLRDGQAEESQTTRPRLHQLVKFYEFDHGATIRPQEVPSHLARKVIQSAVDIPWQQYLNDQVLKPLDMNQSMPRLPLDRSRLVLPYAFDRLEPLSLVGVTKTGLPLDGVYSTLQDIGKLLQLLTAHVPPEAHSLADSWSLLAQRDHHHSKESDAGVVRGSPLSRLESRNRRTPLRWTSGSFDGHESWLSYDAESGDGVFVFVNEQVGGARVAMMLGALFHDLTVHEPDTNENRDFFEQWIAEAYQESAGSPLVPVAVSQATFPRGTFRSDRYGVLSLQEDSSQLRVNLGTLESFGLEAKDSQGTGNPLQLLVEFLPGRVQSLEIQTQDQLIYRNRRGEILDTFFRVAGQ